MFQIYIIFMFAVVYVSNGYIFYALTYLELFPDYTCAVDIAKDQCTHELMCLHKNDAINNVIQVNWDSTRSLHNWVDRLDLDC